MVVQYPSLIFQSIVRQLEFLIAQVDVRTVELFIIFSCIIQYRGARCQVDKPLQLEFVQRCPILFDDMPFKAAESIFGNPFVVDGDVGQFFKALHVLHDRVVGAGALAFVGRSQAEKCTKVGDEFWV